MIDEWKTMTIGEICQAIYDGPHATPHKTETGPIFLGISNLRDGRIDLSGVEHLSEKDFIKWTRRVTPQADDIVFSYETRLGEAALVPDGLKFCLGRRMALMRLDKNKVDPRFLLYAYLAPEFQQTIKSRTVFGSTVDRIPLIEFSSFPITIPPLPTQHAIASVLASLDDKIELNRRMNATLEALAAALFKHWFVDNPEAEGWEEGKLGDVISVNEKSVTRNYPYETIEYIDISSVSRGHLDSTTLYSLNDSPSRAKRLVSHGDTIWSTVRPNRRSYLYINKPKSNLVVSTGFAILTPKKIPPSYLYILVTTDQFVDYLTFNADGSAYPAVLPQRFGEAEIILPPQELLDAFERIVGPMLELIASNEEQSRTLAALRDTLLPKLMRGEVRVSEL
jgi:type I restriction enzyme S subunit